MNMKQLKKFGAEILLWTYTIENGKVIKLNRLYDFSSFYPSIMKDDNK